MTGGLRLDLHVHSDRSPDGRASVDRLVAWAEQQRLDGLALTDHNTVAGHARLAELAREHPALHLLPGVEVSTAEGHLLAYGVGTTPPTHRPVGETIDWISSHGGVAVLAHPFRRVHGVGPAVARTARVPALEAVNGHNGRPANERAARLAQALSVGTAGGSDAHARDEVGRAWTRFPEGVSGPDDLLEALRRGRTVAEGRSASAWERTRTSFRSFALRLGRGWKPI